MKIGFIGLGIMGSRMAANLVKNNYELVVYNRTSGKAAALVQAGASEAKTPKEAATGVDVLFTMLAAPRAVEECAFGTDGFLGALRSGTLWVDCSTVNPSFTRKMAQDAHQRGIRFLDAPVAGSRGSAQNAELNFFVGGDERDLEEARPMMNVMGKNVVHVGEIGMGASLKMVNNLLLGQAMVAFSEAVALGRGMGLSQERLLGVLIGSGVTVPAITGKRTKFESGDYDTEFPLRLMYKDLELAAESAYETGTVLLQGNIAKEAYALAIRDGLGDEDYSALFKLYNS